MSIETIFSFGIIQKQKPASLIRLGKMEKFEHCADREPPVEYYRIVNQLFFPSLVAKVSYRDKICSKQNVYATKPV
jgi:hypothetical protein